MLIATPSTINKTYNSSIGMLIQEIFMVEILKM